MEINMKRVLGGDGISVAQQIDRRDVWHIRTDIQPYTDPMTKQSMGVSFIEHEFRYKPSMAEVKEFVLGVINKQTDEKILSGFVWNGKPVWLSAENQRNFSEAQRMAAENDSVLPLTFKLGEDENGEPVYHTFQTASELTEFYTAAFAYINKCLNEGWQKKDSVDWTPYEEALNI